MQNREKIIVELREMASFTPGFEMNEWGDIGKAEAAKKALSVIDSMAEEISFLTTLMEGTQHACDSFRDEVKKLKEKLEVTKKELRIAQQESEGFNQVSNRIFQLRLTLGDEEILSQINGRNK